MITVKNPDCKLATAKYTKLFKDVIADMPSDLVTFINRLNAWELTLHDYGVSQGDLFKHIGEEFYFYEICDADESVFVLTLNHVFGLHQHEYEQLIKAYFADMPVKDLLKRKHDREDSSSSDEFSHDHNVGDTTSKGYDLPNRAVNPQDENGYLSDKNTNDIENTNDGENHRSSDYESHSTTEDNNLFIQLKNEYLQHIRDILHEFANRFGECFLQVY